MSKPFTASTFRNRELMSNTSPPTQSPRSMIHDPQFPAHGPRHTHTHTHTHTSRRIQDPPPFTRDRLHHQSASCFTALWPSPQHHALPIGSPFQHIISASPTVETPYTYKSCICTCPLPADPPAMPFWESRIQILCFLSRQMLVRALTW